MKDLSITARMLIVALGPAVLVACLLSLWFLADGIRDVERSETARARTLAEGLALAAEYGIASGNRALLGELARPTLAIPSIAAARFTDRAGRTLLSSGEPSIAADDGASPLARAWLTLFDPPRLVDIEQAVLRTDLSEFDDPLFASDGGARAAIEVPDRAGRHIGTLHVTLDLSRAYHRELDSIGRGLLVTALVLLAATPAAVWLARGVSRPLGAVTAAVGRLAAHDYVDRVPVRAGGELGELADGVLHLSAELRSFHARLQDSARIATDDLHLALDALERRNRELDEARDAAERASAFKSEFLANMSHEIRTPMNTIIGTLSTLARSSLDRDQREQVASIDGASADLLALIDDILDITRIETGNLRVESVPCDLGEVLEEVGNGAARHALERGIELVVAAPPPEVPREILGDPLRLRQILSNLLSNAVKFTDRGHVLLDVSLGRSGADAGAGEETLRFDVVDTGIGIPEHQQGRLFAAFAQADMSTTRHYGGAGLGLHICRGLVELMGGDITLESEAGEGSRFTVTLPLEPAPGAATQSAIEPEAPLALRYVDGYAPLETVSRRALALAGVVLDEDGTPSRPPPAATLHGVPAGTLRAADAGAPLALSLPEDGRPHVALVGLVSPDIRHRLRECGFDAWVTRTPRPEALRRRLTHALAGEERVGFSADAAREADTAGPTHPTRTSRVVATSRRPKVLAVDDQRTNLDLLGRYFTHLGVEARFARTDVEAERLLAESAFDLVLLDLHMPGRDGFEIVRRVRASASPNRDRPILALTADAYADSRERALASGFDAVLTKPLTIEQMRGALERWATPPLVSIAACAAAMLDNVEWATGAIATYRDEIPEHLDTLRAALGRRERRALGEAAHALKGVSDVCRVAAVAEAARALEHAVEDEPWECVERAGEELFALLDAAYVECGRELAEARTVETVG